MTKKKDWDAARKAGQNAREAADRAWAEEQLKKQPGTNVVPFEKKEEAKPSYEQMVELLAAMDDAEYERCRRAQARAWGIRLSALDRMRKHACRLRAYRQKPPPPPPQPDLNDLEARVRPILEADNVLDLWLKDWDLLMAGEHRNARLLYLVATSRLFDRPMSVAIKGPSSAGKSEIRKQVLEFFPGEDIVSFTAMSERALLYHAGDFRHKILSMGEAHGMQEEELQNMLLRELMSEGKLVYEVAQKINSQIVTITIVKHGPVSFFVTTTRASLHPENETRMISLEIDDSEEQTRRVLSKLAKTTGLNEKPDDSIHNNWQDFQRVLRILGEEKGGWKVAVPFADALADLIPPRATRLRRDFSQIISCIKSHALIHCYKRKSNERGELLADLDLDYAPVRDLIEEIVAQGAGIAISPVLVNTLNAVKLATAGIPDDNGATAFEIGKLLKLDKSTALRRLRVGADKGFIVNLESRRGMPGKYRCTDQEIEATPLLPTVEQVEEFMLRTSGGVKSDATLQPGRDSSAGSTA